MTTSPDRWREVRRKIDELEARLRRGRLTVATYLAASIFFLSSGFWTDSWIPAAVLSGFSLLAAWITYRVRRTRIEQLRALEALERSLPWEGEEEGAEGSEPDA